MSYRPLSLKPELELEHEAAKGGKHTRQLEMKPFQHPTASRYSAVALRLISELRNEDLDPVALLKDRIKDGTLDVQTARICLDTYKAQRLINLTRSQRLARMDDD